MIQIKSHYGGWKTVEREQAKSFIKKMLDGGCVQREIDGNHLRGISLLELMDDPGKPKESESNATPEDYHIKPIQTSKKVDNPNNVELKDCTVELEQLAREEAFYRFQQNILFSLMVWQNDKKVQESLPSVTRWIRECAEQLNSMVQI